MIQVEIISELVGVPFAEGGIDPTRGLGCLGCMIEVYRRIGRPVPMPDCLRANDSIPLSEWMRLWEKCFIEPWCVVEFASKAERHVGVVLPNLYQLIHASRDTGSVCIQRLEAVQAAVVGYWRVKQ